MRTVVFADPKVAEQVNRDFIPLQLNLSQIGFPDQLPGLQPWRAAYEKDWKHQVAFATSVVLGTGGKGAFGTSGCGHRWELDSSINYSPQRYSAFLNAAGERFRRALTLCESKDQSGLKALQGEIVSQIRSANQCHRNNQP